MKTKETNLLQKSISVVTSSRHVRIAYLVENNESSQKNLDDIYSHGYARWGGRYSLIVPLTNGNIEDNEYWEWLRSFDPDVIYVADNLHGDCEEKIYKTICPIKIEKLKQRNFDNWIKSIVTLPDYSKKIPKHLGKRFIYIARDINNKLYLNNFGSVSNSFTIADLDDFKEFVDDLFVITRQKDGKEELGKIVEYEYEFFNELSKKTDEFVSLNDLSSLQPVYRHDATHEWAETINLFVGDGFVERISYWNSFLSASKGPHNYKDCSLILQKELLENEEFINCLCQYINNKWLRRFANAPIIIRSSVLDEMSAASLLETFKSKIQTTIKYKKINTFGDCAQREYYSNPVTHAVAQTVKLVNTREFLLKYTHPKIINILDKEYYGTNFILDIDLERHISCLEEYGVEFWHLPKLNSLTELFFEKKDLQARVKNNGSLACSIGRSDGGSIKIRLPEDENIFSRILHPNIFPDEKEIFQTHNYSDKGRYLIQLFTLFGGISTTFNNFLSPVVQNTLYAILNESRSEQLDDLIRKAIKHESFSKSDPNFIKDLIIKGARRIKQPNYKLDGKKILQESIDHFLTILKNSGDQHSEEEMKIYKQERKNELEKYAQSLLAKGIIYQGYNLTCRKCGYKNWINIDNLKTLNLCMICKSEIPAPLSKPWNFKVNEELIWSIQEHGLLAQILVLGLLRYEAAKSFLFIPPIDLFKTFDSKNPETDIDLFCIQDGEIIIGEVKSSFRDINTAEINNLIQIARYLKANKVIIAIPLVQDDRSVNKLMDDFKHYDEPKIRFITKKDFLQLEDENYFYLPNT